jgi:hypothetical protein
VALNTITQPINLIIRITEQILLKMALNTINLNTFEMVPIECRISYKEYAEENY